MRIARMLLGAGGICLILSAAAAAQTPDLRPMVVTNVTGSLHIQQGAPCADLETTTPVTSARIELTPAEGADAPGGGKYFTLTRAGVSFAPFSLSGSCGVFSATRSYGEVHTDLERTVSFTAAATATPGAFAVTIPRDDFLIAYGTIADGELEADTKFANEDVTGTIDLAAGTIQMRVALATRVTYQACLGLVCIDETHDGTVTANLSGTIAFPDTDADGVPDRADNCRLVPNPDQAPVPTPVLTPPPDVTLASCASRDFGTAAASDVCNATNVAVTNDAPALFAIGPNTLTWTGRDGMSRTASASQTVTIVDRTAPTFTFVPLDVAMNDCGPATLGTATAADDCAGTPAVTNDAPASFGVGTTPVTWTSTDASGNGTTATQNVVVTDRVAPSVSCVAARPPGHTFQVSAADSCAGAPVIRLGSYVLADGETIKINETGHPGVRFVGFIKGGTIRHFQVGKGEALITATDESGNVGIVACPAR